MRGGSLTRRSGPGCSDPRDPNGLGALPAQPVPPYNPGLTADPSVDARTFDNKGGLPTSRLGLRNTARTVWAPFVNRVNMRQGETHLYVYGADDLVPVPNYGGHSSGSGATPPNNSAFQPITIGPIANAARNSFLYRAGVPFGIGRPGRAAPYDSVRTGQLQTNAVTGGAGKGTMITRRQYTRVQSVPRYTTQPARYPTESAKG